jgi:hypothetical protein
VAGVTYRIAVAGFRQESGNFRLDWQINPCTYRVSPLARNVSPNGAFRQRISVNAPAGCQWTATSDAPWITITSGSNGSGKGRVEFNVAANTVLEPISGTLTVAGQTVTIRQAAGRARIFSVDEGAPEPARWAPLPTTKPLPTPTPTPTVAPPRP